MYHSDVVTVIAIEFVLGDDATKNDPNHIVTLLRIKFFLTHVKLRDVQ